MLVTLALVATLVFFALRLAPGGPFDGERVFPAEVKRNIEARYGLDRPLIEQYSSWVGDVLRGDLRESFQYLGKPVNEILAESLPVSVTLGSIALAFALLAGIPLGVLAAWKRGTAWDTSAMLLAVSGVSLPSYLVASLLILLFSLHLGWLPPALWDEPGSWVLPAATLALRPLALVARLTRASMIESLQADWIRTAIAKGAPNRVVLFHHALRNSLIPVVSLVGPLAANLVTGSFLVETLFQIPGLGKHFVTAVLNRDYPLVMGTTLVYSVILVATNLVVDLGQAALDPRIRLEHQA